MPLVLIDLLRGRPPRELDEIADIVHAAMVEHLDVPARDRFQIITEHDARTLRFDRSYLDVDRDDSFVLVRLTLARGRDTDAKRSFYAAVAQELAARLNIPPGDVTVCLIENGRDDWSFGHGLASYLELPRDAWR